MSNKGDERPIESIKETELCDILCSFFIDLRKSDGSNYEPSSVRGMLGTCSFERYLKSKHGVSLITGDAFAKLNTVLKTKQKVLKTEVKCNLPCRAESLVDGDIETLWKSGELGNHSPESIINTLWWNNTTHTLWAK